MASALQDTADLLRFGEGWVFMSYEFGFVSRSWIPTSLMMILIPQSQSIQSCSELDNFWPETFSSLSNNERWVVDKNQSQMALCGETAK